jgi:hypothetical protein
MSLEKRYLRVESLSGNRVFGFFVIGVPIETVLEIKKQYPDRNFAGPDPRVNEAIKESITEPEKRQIGEHLEIPFANFKFEFQGMDRFVDEATQRPTFKGENGKKFWVYRLDQPLPV